MRRLLLFAIATTLATAQHQIPVLNSCIKEFHDPEMYNYLTFKNTCSEALTVAFVAKDGSSAGGTMDLRAGAKDSVGRSEGKVPKVGSFELYVCPLNSIPVDENNKPVSKPESKFHCQAKVQ